MHTLFLVFAFVLVTFEVTYARSIPIVDSVEAFPFLRSVDSPTEIIRWDSGNSIQLLSSCKLVRITRRGIRCISSKDHLILGWQKMFSTSLEPRVNNSFVSAICLPRNAALCVMLSGKRFFPTNIVRVADSSVRKCQNGQDHTLVGDLQKDLANFGRVTNAT